MSEQENSTSQATPVKSATWPKWLIAGLAVATIGIGVGVADWSRERGEHRRGGEGHQSMRSNAGLQRLCERDPLKFEGVARAFIKADLDLKAEQNVELDKLATTLIPALKELRDTACNNFAQSSSTLTSPERLERLAVILRKAADTADKSIAPAKAFYAKLDEKQKARVDEMAARQHRFGHGGHGRGEHGKGEHGRGKE